MSVNNRTKKKDAEKDRVQEFEDTEKVQINKDGSNKSGQEEKFAQDKKGDMKTPERKRSKEYIVDIIV